MHGQEKKVGNTYYLYTYIQIQRAISLKIFQSTHDFSKTYQNNNP